MLPLHQLPRTLPSWNRTRVCRATIRCVAITPRGADSSFACCRSSCRRQGAAAESNRVLRSFNPPCSQYTSCPELPLPDSNRGRPRDNRPCYPYTKGDPTPSYSSVAVHLVVDPPPTGTRPQGAFVLSCDPFGTHWIAVRFLSRNGGGIYK